MKSDGTSTRQPKDLRRFPRVYLNSPEHPISPVHGARVIWENGEKSEVCDLSYTGVAVTRSNRSDVKSLDSPLPLKLELAGDNPVDVMVQVIRQTDRIVAFDFKELSTEARQALERFLRGKLIGVNTRRIDPAYYFQAKSIESGFTHWYQGPNDTNILLWYSGAELSRAILDLEGSRLEWNHSSSSLSILVGGAIREFRDDRSVPALVGGSRKSKDSEKSLSLLRKAIDVLSQVREDSEHLKPLMDCLSRFCQ